MAKILCITSGLSGITLAAMALVRRLERSGHEVLLATPRPNAELARANTIPYLQLPPVNFSPAPAVPHFQGPLRPLYRWWYKWRYRHDRRRQAVAALGMDGFRQILQGQAPDLLLVDIELHEHLMTCYAAGVPTILLSQWFSLWPQPGLPPLLHDTIPGQGWRGSRLGLRMAWWAWRWQRRWIFGKRNFLSVGTDRRAILRLYAQELGFPKAAMRENYWPGPITYRHLPVLSMTMWEMEFPHPPRTGLSYIGPQVLATRATVRADAATEARLTAIFADREARQQQLICCTLSSFQAGDTDFLQRLIQAVADRPAWQLVIGLGAKVSPASLGALPVNVHAFPWIPQLRVLAQADCSINHGGIHTINECIHFRVPMLVYSGKRSDQNGCAARVHFHGLGLMADKDRDSPADIAKKIAHVLASQDIRQRLDLMHQHYRGYAENKVLARYLDHFLATRAKSVARNNKSTPLSQIEK